MNHGARILTASEDRGDPENGSQPRRLVLCEGEVYRIKWPDDPSGAKDGHYGQPSNELFNEWLACRIAPTLHLRTPNYAIVDVPPALSLTFEGRCFGSHVMTDYEPLPDREHVANSQGEYDRTSLYTLLAFDELLGNPDRKAGDFLRRKAEAPFPRPFLAIDHGNLFFGSHWTPEQLGQRRDCVANSNDPRWLFAGLNDEQAALDAVKRLSSTAVDFAAEVRVACSYIAVPEGDQRAAIEFLGWRWANLERLVVQALRVA